MRSLRTCRAGGVHAQAAGRRRLGARHDAPHTLRQAQKEQERGKRAHRHAGDLEETPLPRLSLAPHGRALIYRKGWRAAGSKRAAAGPASEVCACPAVGAAPRPKGTRLG